MPADAQIGQASVSAVQCHSVYGQQSQLAADLVLADLRAGCKSVPQLGFLAAAEGPDLVPCLHVGLAECDLLA